MALILIALVALFLLMWIFLPCEHLKLPEEVVAVLILVVIAGFRYKVGVDYMNYYLTYESGLAGNLTATYEPFWLPFYFFLHSINGTYNLWFFIVSALTIVPIFYAIHKLSVAPMLSAAVFVATFCYVETFNTVRQCAAMGILFGGLPILLKGGTKGVWGYVCVVAISVLFHYAGVAGLAFIFLRRNFSRWWLMGAVLFTFVLGEYLLRTFVMSYLTAFQTLFVSSVDSTKQYNYDLTTDSIGASSGALKFVYNALALGLAFFADRIEPKRRIFLNSVVFAICWYNLFYLFQAFLRVHLIFFLPIVILIPDIVYSVRKVSYMLIVSAALIGALMLFTVNSFLDIPYNPNPTYALFW